MLTIKWSHLFTSSCCCLRICILRYLCTVRPATSSRLFARNIQNDITLPDSYFRNWFRIVLPKTSWFLLWDSTVSPRLCNLDHKSNGIVHDIARRKRCLKNFQIRQWKSCLFLDAFLETTSEDIYSGWGSDWCYIILIGTVTADLLARVYLEYTLIPVIVVMLGWGRLIMLWLMISYGTRRFVFFFAF